MIRIDYSINEIIGTVTTTWVAERNDAHAMIGRQTLTLDEWNRLRQAIESGTCDSIDPHRYDDGFFRFEAK